MGDRNIDYKLTNKLKTVKISHFDICNISSADSVVQIDECHDILDDVTLVDILEM